MLQNIFLSFYTVSKRRGIQPVKNLLNDVRQFIGGATLQVYEKRKEHPDKIGLMTPILYAYWTTSDFNSSARDYLKKMGVWYLNGVGISQISIQLGI